MEKEKKEDVRVRIYPTDRDETFDGLVIQETLNCYVVIPDYNLALAQRWDKMVCEIIKGE